MTRGNGLTQRREWNNKIGDVFMEYVESVVARLDEIYMLPERSMASA